MGTALAAMMLGSNEEFNGTQGYFSTRSSLQGITAIEGKKYICIMKSV